MGDLTHRGTKEGSGSGWVFPEIISTVKLALSSSLFMPHHDTSGSISVSSADDDGGVPCKLQDLDSSGTITVRDKLPSVCQEVYDTPAHGVRYVQVLKAELQSTNRILTKERGGSPDAGGRSKAPWLQIYSIVHRSGLRRSFLILHRSEDHVETNERIKQ